MNFARIAVTPLRSVRTFATAQRVKVPLTLFGLDGRYATALFTAAAKKNQLDAVEGELAKLKQIIDKSDKVQFFLENPTLMKKNKRAGIDILLGEQKLTETTKNFFDLLSENGRLNQTSKIINSFNSLMMAHRGEVLVTVTSAKSLNSAQLKQLQDSLTKGTLAGSKKLTVQNKVNPSILGGLVIEFGDKTIDMSVSSKVTKLNKMLTDSI
ncbi:ATP synthase F0 subcomplex subunit OSCP atp5 [Basidiobolus ranarum]|uniref:ATP synthase subunit 5, mitochondrial n=1 Tax=Basidiobolus ranarum TaxID=34480 RepID=A0ABR2WTI0_9FUNG